MHATWNGLRPGLTGCIVCGRLLADNPTATRNHLATCDPWGDAR